MNTYIRHVKTIYEEDWIGWVKAIGRTEDGRKFFVLIKVSDDLPEKIELDFIKTTVENFDTSAIDIIANEP